MKEEEILGRKVLIVGAGPGGCMTANHLARSARNSLSKGLLEITILSTSPSHVYEAGFLFLSLDLKPPRSFTRLQMELLDPAVNLVCDPAAAIDVRNRKVLGQSGREYPYDLLLIATGSEVRPDITPGLKEGGDDFYTLEGAARLRDKLRSFSGGKILCTVEMPHKCPFSFLEFLFLLSDHFRMKGLSEKVELAYSYPLDILHQKPEVAHFCRPLLEKKGISAMTGFTVDRVEPAVRKVFSQEGRELDYDLLISIPTHRAPRVILDAGLGDAQGWIDVDPSTLKMNGAENVYAIGDATNLHLKGVPKAGSAARYQSEIVAGNILRELNGLRPNRVYDGKFVSLIETGLEEATCIQFDYRTPPTPPPPSKLLYWFKLSFNELYWSAIRGIF